MRALFFLRHYNDIDHITPVIYKWALSGHQCDVVLIGSGKFRRDYRIQFLEQLSGVRVAHMREVLGWLRFFKVALADVYADRQCQAHTVAGFIGKAVIRTV